MPPEEPPAQVGARLARPQEGAVTRAQLQGEGVSRHTVTRYANSGHLHRRHHGVYVVGHTALAPFAEEWAALLACGEGAVLSRWTAAYLWGMTEHRPDRVHVTLVGRRCRAKRGVAIRTVASIDRRDLRWTHRLPVTSPARTVIDLATESDSARLDRLIAEGRVQNRLRDGDLEAALERAGRRPGVASVRAFLKAERGRALTRSEAERRMRCLVRDAGLPAPLCNARVAGFEVDFFWPQQRLIVEVDGFRFHGHRQAFERDRRKGLALAAAGFPVVRVTARQLMHEELWLAAHLAQALANGS